MTPPLFCQFVLRTVLQIWRANQRDWRVRTRTLVRHHRVVKETN